MELRGGLNNICESSWATNSAIIMRLNYGLMHFFDSLLPTLRTYFTNLQQENVYCSVTIDS